MALTTKKRIEVRVETSLAVLSRSSSIPGRECSHDTDLKSERSRNAKAAAAIRNGMVHTKLRAFHCRCSDDIFRTSIGRVSETKRKESMAMGHAIVAVTSLL